MADRSEFFLCQAVSPTWGHYCDMPEQHPGHPHRCPSCGVRWSNDNEPVIDPDQED